MSAPPLKAKLSAWVLGAVAFAWLSGSVSFGAYEVWSDRQERQLQAQSHPRAQDPFSARLRWAAAFILASGLLSLVVAWLVAIRIQRLILRPIHSLTEASRRVAESQDLGIRVLVAKNNELGHLAETFNTMLQAIQTRNRTISWNRPLADASLAQEAAEVLLVTPEPPASTRATTELLAALSHEFRTPLNGILGLSGFLLEEELTPDARHFSRSIEQSAESLLVIVNDILDYAKLEASQVELVPITFNPRHTVEDVLESAAAQAEGKHLELSALFEASLPEWVVGDPGCLRQVLLNLVDNALRYTERGGVLVRLGLSPKGQLQFEVRDTGIGMSEGTVSRLFRPYTQADHTASRRSAGSGLGLAISRSLVALMGGQIGVDSREGGGSRFWFTAELKPCTSPGPGPDPKVPLLVATPGRPGPRVLLAGPSIGSLRTLESYLKGLGVDLRRCGGAETLDTGAVRGFDLVILAPEGPELESLLARANNLRLAGAPPMVLFSTFVQRGQARLADQSGFAGFLCRPLQPAHVQSVVTGVLQRPPFMVTRHQFEERKVAASGRVLLVEAHEEDQLQTSRLLQKAGWKPYWIEDPKGALEAVQQRFYDLVLMDCTAAGQAAAEAIQQLRSADLKVPIVGLLTNPTSSETAEGLNAGMDAILAKPIQMLELQAILDRFQPRR